MTGILEEAAHAARERKAKADVATIAAQLSDMEREWITGWQGAGGAAFNVVAGDLRHKGLLVSAMDWSLNETGLAVRAHLEKEQG